MRDEILDCVKSVYSPRQIKKEMTLSPNHVLEESSHSTVYFNKNNLVFLGNLEEATRLNNALLQNPIVELSQDDDGDFTFIISGEPVKINLQKLKNENLVRFVNLSERGLYIEYEEVLENPFVSNCVDLLICNDGYAVQVRYVFKGFQKFTNTTTFNDYGGNSYTTIKDIDLREIDFKKELFKRKCEVL